MALVTATITNFYPWNIEDLQKSITDAKKRNQKTLPILINTLGGDVYGLLQMIDTINGSGLEPITIVTGKAMSCGSFLFALGKKRYATPNAKLMIHDVSYGGEGKQSDFDSIVKFNGEINKDLYGFLDKASKKESGFFENLVKENKGSDLFLHAKQAKELGLVSAIKNLSDIEEMLEIESNSFYEFNKVLLANAYNTELTRLTASFDGIKEINIENDNGKNNKNNNGNSEEDRKIMDLTALQGQVTQLQAQILNFDKEKIALEAKIEEAKVIHEKEVKELKATHDKKLKDIEDKEDLSFITALLHAKKISKVEFDQAKDILLPSLTGAAKETYKKQLSDRVSLMGEINDLGENDKNFDGTPEAKLKNELLAIAEKHKIDISTPQGYSKALFLINSKSN